MYSPIPLTKSEKTGVGYWEAYSPKLKRDVTLLGDLEYDYWLFIETDPRILSYCERPILIESSFTSKIITSVPSYWVKYQDNTEAIIKVRFSKVETSKNGKLKNQLLIEEQWCKEKNIKHCVVNDQEIRSNPLLLSNKKLLISIVSNRLHPIDTDIHLISQILSLKKITIQELKASLDSKIPFLRVTEGVCWMIYKGFIKSSLDRAPIGPKLEVWIDE